MPLKVVVFGYHDVGYVCLREILAQRDHVLAVFTHEDDPNENVWFHSVPEFARGEGLPTYTPEDVNTPEWIERIRSLQPDIIFSFYYRKMISPEILAIPRLGAPNMHGSLLPRYRGRAPVNWVLVKGEKETGVTLHYMVEKPDAGDIVGQRVVPIEFEDTAFTLFNKVTAAAAELIHEMLPRLRAGSAPRIPMDLSKGNYVRGRKPADGVIHWDRDAMSVYNLVRAVTHPYPGAFAFLGGRKVLVWEAHPVGSEAPGAAPGTVIAHEGRTALVETGGGLLRVERVQFEGDDETDGAALPLGARLAQE